jgi:metallo-beta-lactamase class B
MIEPTHARCRLAVAFLTGLVAVGCGLGAWSVRTKDTVEAHIAAATRAAGTEHTALLDLCAPPEPPPAITEPRSLDPPPPPDRSAWYVPPVKVFDNLYFVGERDYSAWAVTTSAGIIVLDTLWEYSVQAEIVDGLRSLGFDPANIRYAIVSHAHLDHAGGAKYLQDRFGVHVIMSAPEWETLANDPGRWTKPARDLVAADGQQLTLGDETLTLYITPGHTAGTLSTLIPVRDRGRQHVAAEWGGTGFNFTITPDKSARYWLAEYSRSAERFRDIVSRAGADVLISNHTELDGSPKKIPAVARRRASDPNPYVVGVKSVANFLRVVDECAKATLLRP